MTLYFWKSERLVELQFAGFWTHQSCSNIISCNRKYFRHDDTSLLSICTTTARWQRKSCTRCCKCNNRWTLEYFFTNSKVLSSVPGILPGCCRRKFGRNMTHTTTTFCYNTILYSTKLRRLIVSQFVFPKLPQFQQFNETDHRFKQHFLMRWINNKVDLNRNSAMIHGDENWFNVDFIIPCVTYRTKQRITHYNHGVM